MFRDRKGHMYCICRVPKTIRANRFQLFGWRLFPKVSRRNLYSIHMFAVTYFAVLPYQFDSSGVQRVLQTAATRNIDLKKKNTSQRNLLERIFIENEESRSFLRCQINQNGQSGSVHADFHSAIRTKIAFALLTSGCIFDEIGSRFPRYISYTQMARKKKNKMQIRNQKGSLRDSCPCFDYIWLPLKLRLIASEWAEVPFYLEYQ